MAFVEGIAVSGEYVEGLKDKTFHIIAAPKYVEVPSLDEQDKLDRRLVIRIELANKEQLEYYPNKTSIKMLTAQYGFEMDKWIGKRFEWEVIKQKAFGKDHHVLYIKAKKFEDGN